MNPVSRPGASLLAVRGSPTFGVRPISGGGRRRASRRAGARGEVVEQAAKATSNRRQQDRFSAGRSYSLWCPAEAGPTLRRSSGRRRRAHRPRRDGGHEEALAVDVVAVAVADRGRFAGDVETPGGRGRCEQFRARRAVGVVVAALSVARRQASTRPSRSRRPQAVVWYVVGQGKCRGGQWRGLSISPRTMDRLVGRPSSPPELAGVDVAGDLAGAGRHWTLEGQFARGALPADDGPRQGQSPGAAGG